MRLLTYAASGVALLSMAGTTGAMAAQPTRSATALPASVVTASNFRAATPLRYKSNQSDGDSPVLGYALAAVVAAGIVGATVAATSDNHHHRTPSSPG